MKEREELFMNKYARQILIDNFIEKFDKALEAMMAIDDFKWNIEISITSNNALLNEREDTIKKINQAFRKNGL